MQIRVLGCSGGIGHGLRTTSLLIDDDILIDCGTGVGDLEPEEMVKIQHIFLTHGHLDHIAFIPLLADSLFDELVDNPITIHLQAETMEMLHQNIFNWKIWPDFASLPDESNPVIKYDVITPGKQLELGERLFKAIAVSHTQPAVGYLVQSPDDGYFAFSGDTTSTDGFWNVLNTCPKLDLLFVECAYANHEVDLCQMAGHHRPATLAEDLRKLRHQPELYITHQKPGDEKQIMRELTELVDNREPKLLQRGQVFKL
jgi:ribonuclease BN (tRNA processing enzyme)